MWREQFLSPYVGTQCDTIDWQHLQSLGCLQQTIVSAEIRSTFQIGNPEGIDPTFFETETFKHIHSIWKSASTLALTTLGQVIGSKVAERCTGQRVSFSDWGEH